MKTKILEKNQLTLAADLLISDEIVAFPTETVYGLGARVFSQAAVQKIFCAKNRPSDNPLIAHFTSLEQLEKIASVIPEEFFLLWEVIMPGPLTVVLPKRKEVPEIVSGGLETIAVRSPAHPLAYQLIDLVKEPLVAPSANLSGRPSATRPEHVLEDFSGRIGAVINGGACSVGIESTVLSLLDPKRPKILRPGQITKEQLEEKLEREVLFGNGKELSSSPGMKYRHYSPSVPIRLYSSFSECDCSVEQNRLFLCLSTENRSSPWQALSSDTLYHQFRQSEKRGIEEIIIVTQGLSHTSALYDRIVRAASEKA